MREASIRTHNKLKSYRGPCMYPIKCNNPSVRAHAVQRRGPLALVAEGGFVVAPDKEGAKNLGDEPQMRIKRTGWKEATTFRGLCSNHDSMFAPVESGTLNYSDSEHTFLLAYRACMKTVYELNRGVLWQQFGAEELEKQGLIPPKQINPLRIQAQHFAAAARMAEAFKDILDKAYLGGAYTRLEDEVFDVPGQGGVVASSGMFADRDEPGGAPAFMMVNLVPEAKRHVLLISYLRAQREAHRPYIDMIKTRFGLSLRQQISRLVVMRLRSFALRPSMWRSFPSGQQEAITAALARPEFAGDLAGGSDPKVNLFEAAS